jgi:hypothetical protein
MKVNHFYSIKMEFERKEMYVIFKHFDVDIH